MHFSKLYYGAEVWLIPSFKCFDIKNVLVDICLTNRTILNTPTEIHTIAERALTEQMYLYRYAITLYKLFKSQCPENESISLNF
jgi:hypothetical protein